MKTEPYKIEKHARGQYQVFDKQGFDLCHRYVSLHEARQTVIAHKLQDKALNHKQLIKIAGSITSYTGDWLHNWLYEILIRTSIGDMRLYMRNPEVFRERATELHRINVEARLNSRKNMELNGQ